MQISCLFLKFNPVILIVISGPCLQQLVLWCYNGEFLFSSFLLQLLFEIILERFVICPTFIALFNYLFISLWSHRYFFYSQVFQYKTVLFLYLYCSSFGLWGHSQAGTCILIFFFFQPFLIFHHCNLLQAHHVFSLHQP